MFSLFHIPTPQERARERARQRETVNRRLPLCVPWDPQIKFDKELNFKADTYLEWDLFPSVKPVNILHPALIIDKGPEYYRMSTDETFFYCMKTVPKGGMLEVYYSKQKGTVMFDGDVHVPVLHRKERGNAKRWKEEPWMSTTPMEAFTLRGGTKLAKGHTVIGGLGLGYQLAEVTHRKKVKKVTLVEIDRGLVEMMLPALKSRLGPAPVEVIIGDAEQIVPTLTADVALIDIFDSYGGNEFVKCPNIPRVWCWGSQYVQGSNSLFGW
jgi:hypothetical protein